MDEVTARLEALLRRLTPPRSIGADRESQAAEVRALLDALRFHVRGDIGAWWPAFERHLLEAAKTRAWPTVAEVSRAARMAAGQVVPIGRGSAAASADASAEAAATFFRATGGIHPGLNASAVTSALIRMGLFRDEREARFHGCALDDRQRAAVEAHAGGGPGERPVVVAAQRMSRKEWRHHVSVMAALRRISEDEAEAIEARALSPLTLPEDVARKAARQVQP